MRWTAMAYAGHGVRNRPWTAIPPAKQSDLGLEALADLAAQALQMIGDDRLLPEEEEDDQDRPHAQPSRD